ncbi:MAG: hypothetical protein ACRDWN_08585 [Acidimicrobiales bacterium]
MQTTARRPIDRLVRDWEARCRSGPSVLALRRLAAAEPMIADLGARDLGELVATMRRASSIDERERAAAALRAMLRSQHVHPLVPRAVLQAVLPGLVTVARRLSWGEGGDWDGPPAFFADLVATAWEIIVEWSGQDRGYAVLDLLSAVRCRARRQILRHRTARQQVAVDLDPSRLRPAPWRSAPTDLDELARAIDGLDGSGDPADVAVLYAQRVLGYTISEISRLTGRSRRHLCERRDRAARLLTA